jgi:hypothetical protein
LWDRAEFLYKKHNEYLWGSAVSKYATDSKLPTLDLGATNSSYVRTTTFKFSPAVLAKKFNIEVRGFEYHKHSKSCPGLKTDNEYSTNRNAQGHYDITPFWGFTVSSNLHFVVNDTNVGAVERAKFHYKETAAYNRTNVMILDKADRTKAMKVDAFLKAMHFTKKDRVFNVSTFLKKERTAGMAKNVTIMVLQERGYGGYYREKEMVWKDGGKASQFDSNTTYYYLPLSGYTVESKTGGTFDAKRFYHNLKDCGVTSLKQTVYGVRKGDIEFIKTQKNWVNIEDFVAQELAKPLDQKIVMSMVLNSIDNFHNVSYNFNVLSNIDKATSPYQVFTAKLKGFEKIRYDEQALRRLCDDYAKGVTHNPKAQVDSLVDECKQVLSRYPLLAYLRSVPSQDLAQYINDIDTQKGVK